MIKDWYNRLRAEIVEKGILPCDTYNCDETGFRIGIGEGQWILTLDPDRPRYIRSLCDRELASALKTISGDGIALPL
jgi:hypothetical protein